MLCPDDAALGLDAHLVSLNLSEVTRLDNVRVVDGFGMHASSLKLVADRLRLTAKSMFDGDKRAAPTDERDNQDDECLVSAAAMEDGAGASAEGLAADGAAVAPFLLTMDADVALSQLASCRTGQGGAPYLLRIHGLLLFGFVTQDCP